MINSTVACFVAKLNLDHLGGRFLMYLNHRTWQVSWVRPTEVSGTVSRIWSILNRCRNHISKIIMHGTVHKFQTNLNIRVGHEQLNVKHSSHPFCWRQNWVRWQYTRKRVHHMKYSAGYVFSGAPETSEQNWRSWHFSASVDNEG